MQLKSIISKSKNGEKMEITAIDKNNKLKTLHIQKYGEVWRYCVSCVLDKLTHKRTNFIFSDITI